MWQDELNALCAFMTEKVKSGEILPRSEEHVLLLFADILDMATEERSPDLNDPSLVAVTRHGIFAMRQKLLALHPELSAEIRALGRSRDR